MPTLQPGPRGTSHLLDRGRHNLCVPGAQRADKSYSGSVLVVHIRHMGSWVPFFDCLPTCDNFPHYETCLSSQSQNPVSYFPGQECGQAVSSRCPDARLCLDRDQLMK